MRILYFSQDYCPHDHRMMTAILAGGHEAHFLRLEDGGRLLEARPIPEGVHTINWRGGKDKFHWYDTFPLALNLKEILKDLKPDLIHAGPIQKVGFVAALTGFHPLVSMSWGFDLMTIAHKTPFSRWITRNVLARSNWLFGDCQAVLNQAVLFGYSLERSSYFPWGVDLNHFTPGRGDTLREELGWQNMDILFSNRSWEPQYGVDIVARAFVRAAHTNPRLRLLFLGSGSQREKLERILREGQVLDRVHFPGQIKNTDLPGWYQSADLYISASHTDGSSVSLMEALACGVPVAISDIPSNKEWVTPGEEGWLFRDGSVDELVKLMEKVAIARVDLAVMQIKARRKAETKADWNINQKIMLNGYEQAVKK